MDPPSHEPLMVAVIAAADRRVMAYPVGEG